MEIKLIQDKMAEIWMKYQAKKTAIDVDKRSATEEEMKELNGLLDQHDALKKELEFEKRNYFAQEEARKLQSDPVKPNPAADPNPKKDQGWKSFGEFLLAVHRAAKDPYNIDKRLIEMRAITGASESVPADGGFLVQKDFAAEIFKVMHDTNVILPMCRKIPISGNANGTKINAVDETSRATGSRWGGVQGYWTAEGGEITSSKPKFRQIELNLHKLAALVYATDEVLQDAAQLESIVNQAVPEELNFLIQDALINGNGVGRPLGILNSPALVTQAKTAAQTATTITSANVMNMWTRLWSGSKASAVWLINSDCLVQLWQMSLAVGTAGGSLVWMPANGLSGLPYSTLGGRPVIEIEQCQTLGTVGDIILADFSQYLIAEKGGIDSAMSVHVAFTRDEVVYRFLTRIDGEPLWNLPMTPYKGSNTYSPFVALATRA